MKLKPFAVKVACPVCKGEGGKFNQHAGVLVCYACKGDGGTKGIILAPVDWDGVSEIEWPDSPDKHAGVFPPTAEYLRQQRKGEASLQPMKCGHCGECKWCSEYSYDKNQTHNKFGNCEHKTASFIAVHGVSKDFFGCIYFELKG